MQYIHFILSRIPETGPNTGLHIPVCTRSIKGPYLVLPNRGMTPATLSVHYLAWRLHLPYISGMRMRMLSPLHNLGATVTWTARCYGQDRRNEAQRPAAEKSGSGLAAPCSRWLWLGPCISYICFGHCVYLYSRRRSRPCRRRP